MTYVDAILDRKLDKIRVAEKVDGKLILKEFPAQYVFYYEHSSGTHRSIYGHPVKKFATNSSQKFRIAVNEQLESNVRIFESDINPVFRYLADNYAGFDDPILNIGFFDIETDFDTHNGKYSSGFAPPTDPYNKITAITLHRTADKKTLTYVLKPPTLTYDEAQNIIDDFEDTWLFDDEKELLKAFIEAIKDVNILSSWNGSFYDIPYTLNRVERILSKEATKSFCLWDQFPTERQYKNKFGKIVTTYDLVGRVHLDYLELYAKHNPKQRLSYALNAIGQLVVKESKVQYEGTLDDLYKKEFKRFVEYNRQDVELMVKIDDKLKYIDLHNQVAHSNCVLLKTTMGSVALIEQSIINEMHDKGFVVPNRKSKDEDVEDIDTDDFEDDDEDDDSDWKSEAWNRTLVENRTPVVGAYVAQPKIGLQKEIGCADINSLYPSAIRALNMSPETLVGQVRLTDTMKLIHERASKLKKNKQAESWDGLFSSLEFSFMHEKNDTIITVDFFDFSTDVTTTKEMTGSELYDYIFNPDNHVCITANGTIFRTDVDGIIPQLLARWYSERKEMQAKQKEFTELARSETDEALKKSFEEQAKFWDSRQGCRKILLNSLYGAILNEGFRMYDERLGQSVTLTGRSIVRHMNAKINELITGKYDYKGDAIIYADTDSCYFSAYQVLKDNPDYKDFDWSRENIVMMYDMIADETNETFPEFMQKTFNTSIKRGAYIKAGRELVGSTGLFIKKKKYAILVYDKEGKRLDIDGKPGELKVMGLDLKRSDTPKYMQDFLENLLLNLLCGKEKEILYEDIKQFRKLFKTRPGWEKGSPKKVNDLAKYAKIIDNTNLKKDFGGKSQKNIQKNEKKVTIPGHVRASINWNELRDVFHDSYAMEITDSTRIIFCKLLNNTLNMTSVAYPIDEPHLPQWFKDLPFDHAAMEETIIDKKLSNLIGVLDWNLTDTKEKAAEDLFTW